jgi:hypothetical protein
LWPRNLKITIYRTIILPVVSHGCGTWSVTLKEEHRLRLFENRVLRRIFGYMREEVGEAGEGCIMRNFITCTLHQSNQRG